MTALRGGFLPSPARGEGSKTKPRLRLRLFRSARSAVVLKNAGAEGAVAPLVVAGSDRRLALVAVAMRATRSMSMSRVRPITAALDAVIAPRSVQFGDKSRIAILILASVVVIVGANVAGLLGALL